MTYSTPVTFPGMTTRVTPTSVIFEFGPSTAAASQGVSVQNLAPYTAPILNNGAQVASYNVPTHWWYSRWRHQIAPAKIVNTAQQLKDMALVPPWGPIVPGKGAKDPSWVMPGPMVIAPVTQPMGTTGERPDIGTFNEGSGVGLNGGSLNSALAYAEALNTLPIYRIDERTGRFWDLLAHPKASVYGGNQQAPTTSPDYINPGPPSVQGQPGWEVAHHPEAGYVAFLATEDPYHLETLQATATQIIYWSNFHYYGAEPYATLGEGQTRGMAHSLRTLGLVLIATKYYEDKFGPVPKPLNSYAYWKQVADNQLTHITRVWMNAPAAQRFRAFPNICAFAPWQQDHLLNGLALLAWKNPEWRPLYVWAFGNLYNRCLVLPAYPGPYQLRLGPTFVDGQIVDPATVTPSQFFPDWQTAINFNLDLSINDPSGGFYNLSKAQAQALKADPTNGGKWMTANTYDMFIARNALELGYWLDGLGIVDLHTPYPQLKTVRDQQAAYATKYWNDPNAFQPARQSALAPTGGIIMPTAVSISLGQHVHIDVAFVGPKPPQPPTYTQSDGTIGSLTAPDMSGVLFNSLKVGVSTVTATASGVSGPLVRDCVVTVTSPLPADMTFTPGTVS